MSRGRRIALVLGVVAAFALAGALVTARAIVEGEARLADADAELRKGDLAAAATMAEVAASWYVPGAPHVDAAYARLVHVARTSEANGDRETARLAWTLMRKAAFETRWFGESHDREIAIADANLARLAGEMPRPMMARETTPEQVEKRTKQILAREDAPRAPWIVAVGAGFLAMLAGLVVAVRAVAKDASLARAKLPVAVAAAGAVLWAIAASR